MNTQVIQIDPIPYHLRATCAVCSLPLDPWNCCPKVTAEVAASTSSSGRPIYCQKKEAA